MRHWSEPFFAYCAMRSWRAQNTFLKVVFLLKSFPNGYAKRTDPHRLTLCEIGWTTCGKNEINCQKGLIFGRNLWFLGGEFWRHGIKWYSKTKPMSYMKLVMLHCKEIAWILPHYGQGMFIFFSHELCWFWWIITTRCNYVA